MTDGEQPVDGGDPIDAVGDRVSLDAELTEPVADPVLSEAPPPGRIRRLLGWIAAPLRRIPLPSVRTARGRLILLVLVAGLGSAMTVVGVVAVSWTETADFCGRCHTMGPELKAYEMSPHREVMCAECHVEPGAVGWVKAKINGTRQLIDVLLGRFPTPIPAPDHADLPPTSETCVRCHDPKALVANGGPVNLVLQQKFQQDEPNTRDVVALVIRPAGFGESGLERSVHWHITSEVDYVSEDPRAQTIPYVRIKQPNGEDEQFIASSEVTTASNVQPDIDRLVANDKSHRMDCIDCHNRVGHGIPPPNQSVDNSMAAGRISPHLPYIKREGVDRLSVNYATYEDADLAMDGLRDFYGTLYPLVPQVMDQQLNAAIADLKLTYRLVATPEMRVTGETYPNNLGHQSAPGCFRCHDGAHFKVVNGALTKETIPSACSTCHTFPQIGAVESGVLIGERPVTHNATTWVFDHKSRVSSLDPAGTTCGACHTRTYCEGCHNTAVAQVNHDQMLYNHASVVHETGSQVCAYCHQPAFCATCHETPVLPDPYAHTSGVPAPTLMPTFPPTPLPSILPSVSPSILPSVSP